MLTHTLSDRSLYLAPTPAGAYYCVAGSDKSAPRRFLKKLLVADASPLLSTENLQQLMQLESDNEALEMLAHLQKLGWVQGLEAVREAPSGRLEEFLPELLSQLSVSGKALLADEHGFYIASSGFPHETAEELSGLSANIATLHERYQGVLKNNLGEGSSAWGLIDAAGNAQVGFWPIFIGDHRFALVIGGVPRLNQPALTTLVWALNMRYGTVDEE